MRPSPYKKRLDQPDLIYKNEFIFSEGRDAYRKQSRNPYFSWQQDKRDDWTAGYLYEQRIYNLAQAEKNKKAE